MLGEAKGPFLSEGFHRFNVDLVVSLQNKSKVNIDTRSMEENQPEMKKRGCKRIQRPDTKTTVKGPFSAVAPPNGCHVFPTTESNAVEINLKRGIWSGNLHPPKTCLSW